MCRELLGRMEYRTAGMSERGTASRYLESFNFKLCLIFSGNRTMPAMEPWSLGDLVVTGFKVEVRVGVNSL